MFSVYDKGGLHLAYPESWVLEEESGEEVQAQLTISSPDTAFWTLAVYSGVRDLPELVHQVVSALREEYPDLEPSPAVEEIAGVRLTGQDVNFICLDLTNTARIRACHRGATTLLMFGQAEDRELPKVDPVFQAIATSLLTDQTAHG